MASSLLLHNITPYPLSSSLSPRPSPCKYSSPMTISSSTHPSFPTATTTRRHAALVGLASFLFLTQRASPARADIEDEYKAETQQIIKQVRDTLGLEKSDPYKSQAVKALRQSSNDWVAKYRREKRFAGKPSYSNMYSVLNAVSGHYISYGDGSPIPTKRKTQILDEMDQAERALVRGR